MELRAGYKQTDMGVLPQEWSVVPFSELFSFRNGANADKQAYGAGTPFANVLEVITHSHLRAEDIPGKVLLPQTAIASFSVCFGDLLFNRTSETQEEVGLAAVYVDNVPIVFGGFVIRGRPSGTDLDPVYCGYGFRAPSIRSQIIARGQGVVRANIGQSNLRTVRAVIPPIGEQRAIAEALSDVDALIGALDKFIAKKRDLKQAAMQQLLTGQTRLPGFSGKWRVMRFGDIASIRNQKVMPADVDPESPCVELENVGQGNGRVLSFSEARFSTASKYRFCAGDILFGRLRPYLRKYWLADRPGICTTEIWPLMVFANQATNGFLHAIVQTDRFIDEAGVSYGTHMPRVDWSVLQQFEVRVPAIAEQTVIAEVLADMDAELTALEARRDKTRALKQGVMQELLTGRIRLV